MPAGVPPKMMSPGYGVITAEVTAIMPGMSTSRSRMFRVLPQLVAGPQFHLQLRRVAHFIGGDDPWPERREGVVGLECRAVASRRSGLDFGRVGLLGGPPGDQHNRDDGYHEQRDHAVAIAFGQIER